MREGSDHSDFADLSGFQELHARNRMRRDTAMQSDLYEPVGFAGRLYHRFAFVDGVADRFLHINMRSYFYGVDGWERVPVIGRGYDCYVGSLLLEHLPIILISPGLIG